MAANENSNDDRNNISDTTPVSYRLMFTLPSGDMAREVRRTRERREFVNRVRQLREELEEVRRTAMDMNITPDSSVGWSTTGNAGSFNNTPRRPGLFNTARRPGPFNMPWRPGSFDTPRRPSTGSISFDTANTIAAALPTDVSYFNENSVLPPSSVNNDEHHHAPVSSDYDDRETSSSSTRQSTTLTSSDRSSSSGQHSAQTGSPNSS